MTSLFVKLYKKVVIEKPYFSLMLVFSAFVFFLLHSTELKLDASSESIVLENDQDLKYYRSTLKTYGSDDFLIITFSPKDDLFSPSSLTTLKSLRDELSKLERVESVLTILDVPLLNSPRVSISELTDGDAKVRTLETPDVDLELARLEFLESPIYRNNLVSLDGLTAAVVVNFKTDERYQALLQKRNQLREKKKTATLTAEETTRLEEVSREFIAYHARIVEREGLDIQRIRAIMGHYREHAQLYLGGVQMITSDMISFIEHDIVVFGIGVTAFLIAVLCLFFRKLRWVLIPMSSCLISVGMMMGFLGFTDWNVTVISSNFTSLLLIITMSLTIHLIVRYRILCEQCPNDSQQSLVFDTMKTMVMPSFFTAMTTIVAFCSLVVSDIRPVIDFGWMMTIGIALAFVLNFLYFPSVLSLLPVEKVVPQRDLTRRFTSWIATWTLKHATFVMIGGGILALIGIIGITKLKVENRFIDNFKSTTEIYRGMDLIDSQLGGTIPLDIIIDADADFYQGLKESQTQRDPFDDPFDESDSAEEVTYWFNGDRLGLVEKIHDHLEELPEVGKVLSIATGMKVFKQLNDQKIPEDYELALLRKWAPDSVKQALINPYLSPDGNQVRLTMRLIESAPTLNRKLLIEEIRSYLTEDMGLLPENVHLTGMAVLYNNLLQSLYTSQIQTLGVVFVSILVMFVIAFRQVAISLIAIVPNILAAGVVLGLMGWVGIPLDMMTITIAAITIGIGVDDTIHYVHRFQVEFPTYQNYRETVKACHGSIGIAMYYTSLIITVGFSILALSNFIPTIYFGLLTGVAMLTALMSNLTLLAAMLVVFKPLGPERKPA
ncbi:MAG: MMPL family transporter [Nitrospirales bacterium]|nr:MMPL family transporter [Nitrospira sp.]MDR4501130.1 MMPL family transporter [Nitrospirales bacterium]